MNRWLKRGALGVLILALGMGALVSVGLYMGEQRAARHIDITVTPVALRSIRHGVGTDVATIRSGKRPDGSAIAVMPFSSLKTMNDTDLRALHMYLAQFKG